MVEPMNSFEWADKLECPPTACTDPVKKILCKGMLELLWTEIGNASLTNKEVRDVRKNILLYKLKHRQKDTNVECIKNIAYLKEQRKRLKILSLSLKEDYEQQDFLVRQKVEQLRNIKSKYSLTKIKKELLKIKYNEICNQLRDCNDMRLICQNLMPKTSEDLNQDMLKESLNAVATLCFGASKREVKGKILNSLGHIKVPTLWVHLYQGLCQDVDNLMKLRTTITSKNTSMDNIGKEYLDANEEDIDTGIARLCGKYICIFSKKLFSEKKANEYQHEIMKYIENIETCVENNINVSEWLSLALEVQKLEIEDKVWQSEIKAMQSECSDNVSTLEFQQLEIQTIDAEIEKCVENIEQSMAVLKCAEFVIISTRDRLQAGCMNLLALRDENYNSEWLNNDLNTELNIFYDVLDIRALRRIQLQGEIRVFKHETCTLKEASIVITPLKVSNIIPYFPMIQAPIYCLIDCYKNLITNYTYQSIEASLAAKNNDLPVSIDYTNNYNTMELLILSKRNCESTQEEINAFNVALKAWTSQTVQEAMALVDKTVDNLSFTEWTQRYTLLLYMIESAKNK
ncbi:hypothetical protein KPH14_004231 [Odynerus spinipes]|uniref:Uncharacterized protein n=1 Tax=Odynerus spinipes TaxID=1348599 RepID=A0AAD9RYA3_9HYME|nr:hypothetical protein KPH14_004231 [Odynerus spinipes]